MLIKELMTRDVITVSPDATLKEVGKIFKEKRISGVPVVDDMGNIVGIITVTDILTIIRQIFQWQEVQRRTEGLNISEFVGTEWLNKKVSQVMKGNVYTLEENKNIHEVMELMFKHEIHTIPIMKEDKLVGIIGKRDLVFASF
ncbi:MAG: CBS domain-containing protein [Candidatus Omnitrophica bacterium]|nr:CBS domain-containing protein [Candidatus Omnitrophota bacterium]MDD5237828.1 CBS domain-containing protein [Candidatus Omnitrophota bacterium]